MPELSKDLLADQVHRLRKVVRQRDLRQRGKDTIVCPNIPLWAMGVSRGWRTVRLKSVG